jgi:hypothetical protein
VKESIADMDAFLLNFAASGMTTDVGLIIDVMCSKTKSELDAVDLAYRRMFDNKTLKGFVDGALGGDLAEFLGYMQMEEEEFDSYVLHKAFKGMGCDKDVVLEIFCTRPQARLQASRDHYEARKDSSLVDRLRKELSGDLERMCLKLLSEVRHNSNFDADRIATELYAHGEGKWGTDEAGFIDVFSGNSQEQLQSIAQSYERQYKNSLLAAVKAEFSGHMKTALSYLLMDPVDLTCQLLKRATVDRMGTNEAVVNRCIGGHDKKGVREIARRFFRYIAHTHTHTATATHTQRHTHTYIMHMHTHIHSHTQTATHTQRHTQAATCLSAVTIDSKTGLTKSTCHLSLTQIHNNIYFCSSELLQH